MTLLQLAFVGAPASFMLGRWIGARQQRRADAEAQVRGMYIQAAYVSVCAKRGVPANEIASEMHETARIAHEMMRHPEDIEEHPPFFPPNDKPTV